MNKRCIDKQRPHTIKRPLSNLKLDVLKRKQLKRNKFSSNNKGEYNRAKKLKSADVVWESLYELNGTLKELLEKTTILMGAVSAKVNQSSLCQESKSKYADIIIASVNGMEDITESSSEVISVSGNRSGTVTFGDYSDYSNGMIKLEIVLNKLTEEIAVKLNTMSQLIDLEVMSNEQKEEK